MKPIPTISSRGFSLVEVTIAMAIAAIGILSVIGLIPQGMDTMRKATDQAIEGRIHQQILSEVQMADYDALDTAFLGSGGPLEIYYDDQGEEIGDSLAGNTIGGTSIPVYTARITIPKVGLGSAPTSLGGASFPGFSFGGGGEINPYTRLVVVEVAAVGNKGKDFNFGDSENRKMISTYQSTVVKMGKDLTAAAPATP